MNAADFLNARADVSLTALPPGEVDLFLCTQLNYPDYTGFVPADGTPVLLKDALEGYLHSCDIRHNNIGDFLSPDIFPVLEKLPRTLRYAGTLISDYVSVLDLEKVEQFSAITLILPDGSVLVTYRGTDDSVAGWWEDFNLAAYPVIPSMKDALEYLNRTASKTRGPIRVCGHSKGGTMAVWASCMAGEAVRSRIIEVYSFDGPGLHDDFFSDSAYEEMKSRITTVLSYGSLFGVLLKLAGTIHIAKTEAKALNAHNGFRWEVDGDSFLHASQLSQGSQDTQAAMRRILNGMSGDEIAELAERIFGRLKDRGATIFRGIDTVPRSERWLLISAYLKDKKLHHWLRHVLHEFRISRREGKKEKKRE